MSLEIDVIDMTDSTVGSDVQSGLGAADSVKVAIYGMSNGVGQMITSVIQAAGDVCSVNVLRIWSHGGQGAQNVSGGVSARAQTMHWAGVSVGNLGAMRGTLSRLTPYFAHGARVELRGCEVASGIDCELLLSQLARLWRVRVQAGIVDLHCLDWVGPVVQANPDGALCSTTGTYV